jgi:hypothetical protein
MSYNEMMKVGNVLVLIAFQNAISERGFSLMNNVKTKNKNGLDKGLDPKCRVVSLGPTDGDAIGALVDHCTPVVFGNATPARAIGAAAKNVKRGKAKEEKGKGRMTAAEVIKGDNNKTVTGDGTDAPTATSVIPFPSDKYQTDIGARQGAQGEEDPLPVRRRQRQRPAVQAIQRGEREATGAS